MSSGECNTQSVKVDEQVTLLGGSQVHLQPAPLLLYCVSNKRSNKLKNKNNMSDLQWGKFCNTESEAKKVCYLYKNGLHPTKLHKKIDVWYAKVNHKYVVFRSSDNEIMLSMQYVD